MDPALRKVDILSAWSFCSYSCQKTQKLYMLERTTTCARISQMKQNMRRGLHIAIIILHVHARVLDRVQALLVNRRSSLISAYSLPVEIPAHTPNNA